MKRCLISSIWISLLLGAASLYAHRPFVVWTPPKCGTHLIAKALDQLVEERPLFLLGSVGATTQECLETVERGRAEGYFVVAHNFTLDALQALAKGGYRIILILRDPRDQLVSMQAWMRRGQWQHMRVAHIESSEEQLEELITGKRFGWRCFTCIGARLGPLTQLPKSAALITRFEDLVGPEGGGSSGAQLQALRSLCNLLEIEPTGLEEIADSLFGGSKTFRKGQIGSWKEAFTQKHRQLYKALQGRILIELGYEKDLNW